MIEERGLLLKNLKDVICLNMYITFNQKIQSGYDKEFNTIKNENIKKLEKLENKYSKICLYVGEKYIYNYTEENIPSEVKRMLACGPKFSVPYKKEEVPIPNIIKDIEYNLDKCEISEDEKTIIRNRSINVITNFYNNIDRLGKYNQMIKDYDNTKKWVKDNSSIVIINSDKGNSTVLMNKEEYKTAMRDMLKDNSLYEIISKDPTNIYQDKAKEIIERLCTKNYITHKKQKWLKKTNGVPPKLYGMRKTHKNTLAMRPVVSCINSPAYEIAKFTHELLSKYTKTLKYNVTNSQIFVKKIKNVKLPDNYRLLSLDVTSLFTNIPKDLVKEIIDEEWNEMREYLYVKLEDETKKYIDKDTILEMIDFIFDSSYFKFDDMIYKQIDGSAMGNPASPTLANLVMNNLIKNTLKKFDFNIPFLYLYVDDTILAIPMDKIDIVIREFNNFHPKLKFTYEMEVDGKIPFLDTIIRRNKDGTLSTTWYQKPTASNRTLNYLSCTPTRYKRNTELNMIHKIESISSPEFINENLEKMREILKKNNYPKYFINKIINDYYNKKRREENTNIQQENPRDNTENAKYLKFEYIPHLSRKIEELFKNIENSKIVFYNNKRIHNLFTRVKDKDPVPIQSNLIYKINCKTCTGCYIGQTRQYLKERVSQHRGDCKITNINKPNKTALATHHFQEDEIHHFDFDNPKIIDKESQWLKRNISEMIQIELHTNSINFRTDTKKLSPFYKNLLMKYRKNRKY
jgi:hypothetical protein